MSAVLRPSLEPARDSPRVSGVGHTALCVHIISQTSHQCRRWSHFTGEENGASKMGSNWPAVTEPRSAYPRDVPAPTAAAHTQQVAEELPTYPSGAALWLPGTFLLLVLGGSDLSGSFPAPCLSLSLMTFLNNSCTSPPALLGVRERCLHLTAADPHTVACEAPVFWAFEVELLG